MLTYIYRIIYEENKIILHSEKSHGVIGIIIWRAPAKKKSNIA